jgi:hypothetical protein
MDALNAAMELNAITVLLEKHSLTTENALTTAPQDIFSLTADAKNVLLLELA